MKELLEGNLTRTFLGFFVVVLIAVAIGMTQNSLDESGSSAPLAVRLQAGEADPTHVAREFSTGVSKARPETVESPEDLFDIPEGMEDKAWITDEDPPVYFTDKGMEYYGGAEGGIWLRTAEFYERSGKYRCYIVDDDDLAFRATASQEEDHKMVDLSEVEPGFYLVDNEFIIEVR